ncbi:MAG: hypothetical protein OEZ68_09055 [Gammaproteobacteria bacterium]|nr:hypothetical protein [Gammaproteobacteria bacterium]MDH5800936.1 hypothetical protein [Gammaproteobacteria bacterium]
MPQPRFLSFYMFGLLMCFNTIASELSNFRSITSSAITTLRSDKPIDIDRLIRMQEQLMQLGIQACSDYALTHPQDAHIIKLVIDSTNTMRNLTLAQIDSQWHTRQALLDRNIEPEKIEHFSLIGDLMNTIIHPATAYIALVKYKKTRDKQLLQRAEQELSDLLQHLDHIH